MEKRPRIEAISGEIPEVIIQHIQSFLNGNDAARTSTLSKAWYAAWLTRPDLDFPDLDIAKKTLLRYEESNRKLHSFRLSIDDYESGNISLAQELILKAIKLGTTEISVTSMNAVLHLPNEVLNSENLVRLSVHNCKIDLQDQKLCCSRLKYLNFSRVYIKKNTFWDIISICPLIEELIFSECKFRDDNRDTGSGLGAYCFHNLKVLFLEEVDIDERLFRDFSSRFPCLKDLALHNCICYHLVDICSKSLECISLTEMLRAHFDVPRIQKFKFSGSYIPSLHFEKIPREWESDITITLTSPLLKTSWFFELSEFLHKLSPSKMSLFLSTDISCRVYDIPGVVCLTPKPPVVVEKLTLVMYAPYSLHHAFLDGLFGCCRPSFINLYWLPSWCSMQTQANNDFTELLCETLIKESGEKRNMSALHDLEEVNVGFFDDEECCPLPCKTLSDAAAYSGNNFINARVCLQLRWGGSL